MVVGEFHATLYHTQEEQKRGVSPFTFSPPLSTPLGEEIVSFFSKTHENLHGCSLWVSLSLEELGERGYAIK